MKLYWQEKYPRAFCWSFGDSPALADELAALADELAALVVAGKKRGTCSSLVSYQKEQPPVTPGAYRIVLNGTGDAVCVIRTHALRLIRFNEMSADLAALEGEGDLSLAYWQAAHRAFFEREGNWSPEMELVYEEFTVLEIAP
ncbi:ASCH domain-containing protein [Salmonella enterica]|uniref:ASCH domain-containing protein n=1 Tax=Salmonella enterica TaxID=28901 RepID=A0A3J5QZC9_SALER|nr:ASCH domain-containing protein [Salmonella enterica]ECC8719687.1 ASCH domain-containing protein [Salmonella enterica subsp. houtenae]ECU4769697.1 ASCH domain-containing protein [Salmonella enterica subsp. enterica]EDQ1017676.1 ASCH domain-containing protein [Salmonella enterica subsp. houtenae serovar 50:z4,z23:-]EDW0440718.1 ASCH domain-containing protein [Salmonella enterica subsp. arizonae serovar 50:z4,z23:-]HAE7875450.1 ASCH domain-containing protein [Salmonella enterica subsp. enteric